MPSKMNANRAAVAELRKQGLTYPDIAKQLKLSTSYVQVLNGSDGRRGGSRHTSLSDRDKLDIQIKRYAEKDLPSRIIGLILDIPSSTVRYRLSKLGLPTRKAENEVLFRKGKRRCKDCADVKPLDEFNKNKLGARGYMGVCKPCAKIRYRGKLPKTVPTTK